MRLMRRPGNQRGFSVRAERPRSGRPRPEEDSEVPDWKWLGQVAEEVRNGHQSERTNKITRKNGTYLVFCSPHPRTSKTDKEASFCVTRLRAKVKTGTRSEAFLAHHTNTMLTCLSFTSEINASEGLFGGFLDCLTILLSTPTVSPGLGKT